MCYNTMARGFLTTGIQLIFIILIPLSTSILNTANSIYLFAHLFEFYAE